MRIFTWLSLLFTMTACTTLTESPTTPATNDLSNAPGATDHNNLNSVLWVQTSSEYRATVLQTYRSAAQSLQSAIDDKSWTAAVEQTGSFQHLPPAIVLDVDETVLDNSAYQAQLVIDRDEFKGTTWDVWIQKKEAEAIPGAAEFIKAARSQGLAILLVTNRECKQREGDPTKCPQESDTLENLKAVGITGFDPESLLLKREREEWGSEKESRRKFLAEKYRLIMLFGDDLGDFLPNVKQRVTPADREALVDQHQEKWGVKWYMLPNPTYGSWQRALSQPWSQHLSGYKD